MKNDISNEMCVLSAREDSRHEMVYDYTWLISWDTGFVTNIVKCRYCHKRAQYSTMYAPEALYSSNLTFRFKDDTIHRRIINGEIVDSHRR